MSASKRVTVGESATNLRFQCLQLMLQMQQKGGSLTRLLPDAQMRVAASEQSQLQAWSFGWSRWSHELTALIDPLLDKPLKAKDLDIYLLLQLGVFQLRHTPTAAHAAVDETVKVVKRLKKPWARGLVNAVLRNYQRQIDKLEEQLPDNARYSHPEWLLQRFRNDWPAQWESICGANNLQAPMWLRVNRLRCRVDDYQQRLLKEGIESTLSSQAPDAVMLQSPLPVSSLPGFEQGDVSVQDAAAQLAAHWLKRHAHTGARLLDACAAPGGKTAHAAECGWFSHITAIDQDEQRLARVSDTLQRVGLDESVALVHADACTIDQWWDTIAFNAVLLDAPCSGTGVIRRHPDIKLLRRETDIATLVDLQRQLLDALWRTLDANGLMLYATCSILKEENEQQVDAFLQRTPDARLLEAPLQILPGEQGMDGFFYAAIRKLSP